MRRLLPLLTLAILLAGCATRERANPFDPDNPNTSGRPIGFVALAGNGRVHLHWQRSEGGDLIGYQLFRRSQSENSYTAITGLMATPVTDFLDLLVTNGIDQSYRLYFVFGSGLGSRPAEDIATPGLTEPWLVENGGTDAIQATPDARHVAQRLTGFEGTDDIAVNMSNGTVWVSDNLRGQVVVFSPLTGIRTVVPVSDPVAIAVDPYDNSGWVCDLTAGNNAVYHFRQQGDPATFPISTVNQPIDAAVDVNDGSVWICERGANRVSRYDGVGPTHIWSTTCAQPSRVAVDTTTREGWVTSFTRGTVTRIDFSGQPLDTLSGFSTPVGVAVDSRHGRIWVADPGAGEVIALRRDGSVEFRLGGLLDAGEIAVDVRTGDAWAVLGDPGELVRISPPGIVRRRLGGFTVPISVAVDPNGH
jgi:DNA-binding beta-propeller fold protein YncE